MGREQSFKEGSPKLGTKTVSAILGCAKLEDRPGNGTSQERRAYLGGVEPLFSMVVSQAQIDLTYAGTASSTEVVYLDNLGELVERVFAVSAILLGQLKDVPVDAGRGGADSSTPAGVILKRPQEGGISKPVAAEEGNGEGNGGRKQHPHD